METIPKTQRAIVLEKFGPEAILRTDVPVPKPAADEALVRIVKTGHSDLHIQDGEVSVAKKGIRGGHEGAGFVVAVGDKVKDFKVGDRVGVRMTQNVCNNCEPCFAGHTVGCINRVDMGMAADGTFAEYCTVQAVGLIKLPDNVSFEQAAPVLCAGLTVYKGLKLFGNDVKPGNWVVIPGAGGGLGHLAVQYGKAMGFRIVAIDGGKDKEELCKRLGAEVFLDFTKEKNIPSAVRKVTGGGAHGALICATSQLAYSQAPGYLRPFVGVMVCVALPHNAKLDVPIVLIASRNIQIRGTIMGSKADTIEALDFVARGLVHNQIEVLPMSKINHVYDRMRKGDIAGRIVLDPRL
ncbi:hypothetical protein SmJEL517_g01533 [Synchytrium microbalum]|uniref:alcohol dehydrogenase n=1 Tax=Synchytrium microbalum TaxID=1806994 RepID=A0A507CEK0_9FUNG|nr:uncharacterized protein SmJEL517_g01533 [Synchytrium microbalum]TPX36334.1 hypothetical protein SmJEL517_g01533 [Synchytrium microbalum]